MALEGEIEQRTQFFLAPGLVRPVVELPPHVVIGVAGVRAEAHRSDAVHDVVVQVRAIRLQGPDEVLRDRESVRSHCLFLAVVVAQ
ncbi:MAG: hypothetical protein ACK55Z_34545, partial [bacterium]